MLTPIVTSKEGVDLDLMTTSRRARLRLATASQHAALDRLVDTKSHFSSLEGYGAWLQGGYGFHRDVERQLAPSPLTIDLPVDALRRRTALLAQDLADLNLVPAHGNEVDAPVVVVSQPASAVEALGILYVTEGASLGARVLLVRARKLGLSEGFGARQLNYAAQDFVPWRQLLTFLESFECKSHDEDLMVAAAQRTFASAAAYLSRQA